LAQDPDDSFLLLGGKGPSAVDRCDVADQASPERPLGLAGLCSPISEPRLVTSKTHDIGRVDHCIIAAVQVIGLEKTPEDHDTRLSLAARLQQRLSLLGISFILVVVHAGIVNFRSLLGTDIDARTGRFEPALPRSFQSHFLGYICNSLSGTFPVSVRDWDQ